MTEPRLIALVLGSGDIASAVAHRLFRVGHAVLLHDEPRPAVTRRRMAFTDAVFDGEAWLGGARAVRCDSLEALPARLAEGSAIPVIVTDLAAALDRCPVDVLIDGRMRKRSQPEPLRGRAPLTIGLGPNFVAGERVDVAVETSWDDLGRVVTAGPTLPFAGEPRAIGGHARERYVYAPAAGLFRTNHEIGALVAAGEVVA